MYKTDFRLGALIVISDPSDDQLQMMNPTPQPSLHNTLHRIILLEDMPRTETPMGDILIPEHIRLLQDPLVNP